MALIERAVNVDLVLGLLYLAFALIVLWLAIGHSAWSRKQFVYWVDAAVAVCFATLGSGQSVYFALILFFPACAVAVNAGLMHAAALTALGGAALLAIQLGRPPHEQAASLPEFALPIALLGVAGYFIADVAKLGDQLKRRVEMSQKLGDFNNARLGYEGLVRQAMEEMAELFQASAGLMMLPGSEGSPMLVELAHGRTRIFPAPPSSALELPVIPGNLIVHLHRKKHRFLPGFRYHAVDMNSGNRVRDGEAQALAVADLLEAESMISVPVLRRGRAWGRMHLASARRTLTMSDALWLRDFVSRLEVGLANADLLQQMIEDATAQERNQISRNLHDSAIQPYLGLKFGLEALARRVAPEDPLRPDVDRLAALANEETLALRKLVRTLDGQAGLDGDTFERAIRRHAARFARLFNMQIEVDFLSDDTLTDEMAGHVLHMVTEGLSNASRHTQAQRAAIRIACRHGELELQLRNSTEGWAPRMFTPRSLAERARELGGHLEVSLLPHETVVSIKLAVRREGEGHAG
jgi:signal transduction histidine kinase